MNDAAAYKSSHGYPADMRVLADPSWQKVTGAIQHPNSIALPFIVLLDGENMEILKVDVTAAEVVAAVQAKTGITIEASCEGACGGAALAGCYCDNVCEQYGDCCPDYKSVCP